MCGATVLDQYQAILIERDDLEWKQLDLSQLNFDRSEYSEGCLEDAMLQSRFF